MKPSILPDAQTSLSTHLSAGPCKSDYRDLPILSSFSCLFLSFSFPFCSYTRIPLPAYLISDYKLASRLQPISDPRSHLPVIKPFLHYALRPHSILYHISQEEFECPGGHSSQPRSAAAHSARAPRFEGEFARCRHDPLLSAPSTASGIPRPPCHHISTPLRPPMTRGNQVELCLEIWRHDFASSKLLPYLWALWPSG